MIPSAAGLAPSVASKRGIAAVAISCPTSENKLANPIPSTVELNQ